MLRPYRPKMTGIEERGHPFHRKSIRLKGHDYSGGGAYFVTICTTELVRRGGEDYAIIATSPRALKRGRFNLFGHVDKGRMILNELGRITTGCWLQLPEHFPEIAIDEFIAMPNHVHFVVLIGAASQVVGAQHAAPSKKRGSAVGTRAVLPGSLGALVRSFKSAVTRKVNEYRSSPGARVWQRNYYERVIRDAVELGAIRKYISDNPTNWESDDYFV